MQIHVHVLPIVTCMNGTRVLFTKAGPQLTVHTGSGTQNGILFIVCLLFIDKNRHTINTQGG